MTRPSRRVLVVDDDLSLLENLGAFLNDQGFETTLLADSTRLLEVTQGHELAAAIIDYRLGMESGVEVFRALRRERPTLPIVLVSAHMDVWLRILFRPDDYITCLAKPFDERELLDAIGAAHNPRVTR